LREQDIHKIADVFNAQKSIVGFSKMVPLTDIEANDYNLNIPRYIESQDTEDIQDIEAHLVGGIPNIDIDALQQFWNVYPNLKKAVFSQSDRPKYSTLKVTKDDIKTTIFEHPEFVAFTTQMDTLFNRWNTETTSTLKSLTTGFNPKELIHTISENLLQHYHNKALIDTYDMYQHLMSYWFEMMQDDSYLITQDGWKATTHRIIVENKAKKKIDKGWTCDLIPKELVIDRYFKTEKEALETLQTEKETLASDLVELEEEHSAEDGYFAEMDKVNKANINIRIKELNADKKSTINTGVVENRMAAEPSATYKADIQAELKVLKQYLTLLDKQTATNKKIKEAEAKLDAKLYAKYPTLTEDQIKQLVVDDKWMQTIEGIIKDEIDHISQHLTNRVKELAERYENPLPLIDKEVESLESKVSAHLLKMGFLWN
jgi:type I restriction enzyme M protein